MRQIHGSLVDKRGEQTKLMSAGECAFQSLHNFRFNDLRRANRLPWKAGQFFQLIFQPIARYSPLCLTETRAVYLSRCGNSTRTLAFDGGQNDRDSVWFSAGSLIFRPTFARTQGNPSHLEARRHYVSVSRDHTLHYATFDRATSLGSQGIYTSRYHALMSGSQPLCYGEYAIRSTNLYALLVMRRAPRDR